MASYTRIIFTHKADRAISEIKKQYGLENITGTKKSFALFATIRSFAKKEISEEDMANKLKKEMEIPIETAEQITKKIIAAVLPHLIQAPSESFNDSAFVEEISKKVFGESKTTNSSPPDIKKPLPPQITKITTEKKEVIKEMSSPPTKREKIKPVSEEIKQKPKQKSDSDRYREPIE